MRRRRIGAQLEPPAELVCESDISPDDLPRLPLFPGQRQHWAVVAKQSSPEMAEQLLQTWRRIIPGDIGPPEFDSHVDPTNVGDEPSPAITAPRSTEVFTLSFDYHGQEHSMRWPTYVLRRRDRIDPVCPMDEVDAIVVSVNPPSELAGDGILPAPDPLRDDFDLGLPQLPPLSKIGDFLKVALPISLGAIAVGFIALELWRGRSKDST